MSGAGYFDLYGLDSQSGEGTRDGYDARFDAVEIAHGDAADRAKALDDVWTLLLTSHPTTPLANPDRDDGDGGAMCTYVAVPTDDPGEGGGRRIWCVESARVVTRRPHERTLCHAQRCTRWRSIDSRRRRGDVVREAQRHAARARGDRGAQRSLDRRRRARARRYGRTLLIPSRWAPTARHYSSWSFAPRGTIFLIRRVRGLRTEIAGHGERRARDFLRGHLRRRHDPGRGPRSTPDGIGGERRSRSSRPHLAALDRRRRRWLRALGAPRSQAVFVIDHRPPRLTARVVLLPRPSLLQERGEEEGCVSGSAG